MSLDGWPQPHEPHRSPPDTGDDAPVVTGRPRRRPRRGISIELADLVLVGFVPWIAWTVSAGGDPTPARVLAITLAVVFAVYAKRRVGVAASACVAVAAIISAISGPPAETIAVTLLVLTAALTGKRTP